MITLYIIQVENLEYFEACWSVLGSLVAVIASIHFQKATAH